MPDTHPSVSHSFDLPQIHVFYLITIEILNDFFLNHKTMETDSKDIPLLCKR